MLRYCVSGGIITNGKSAGMAQKSVFAAAKKFWRANGVRHWTGQHAEDSDEIYRREEDFEEKCWRGDVELRKGGYK